MTDAITPPSPQGWRRPWVQNVIFILIGILGLYGFIYVDVQMRAKESFHLGEQYLAWYKNPDLKVAHYADQFKRQKSELDEEHASGKVSDGIYQEKLDTLEFDRDFHINESSLKYAYQWYKDTYELFSPPESKWVKQARQKAPEVLEMWKQELREKNIPFEDYMFQ